MVFVCDSCAWKYDADIGMQLPLLLSYCLMVPAEIRVLLYKNTYSPYAKKAQSTQTTQTRGGRKKNMINGAQHD